MRKFPEDPRQEFFPVCGIHWNLENKLFHCRLNKLNKFSAVHSCVNLQSREQTFIILSRQTILRHQCFHLEEIWFVFCGPKFNPFFTVEIFLWTITNFFFRCCQSLACKQFWLTIRIFFINIVIIMMKFDTFLWSKRKSNYRPNLFLWLFDGLLRKGCLLIVGPPIP